MFSLTSLRSELSFVRRRFFPLSFSDSNSFVVSSSSWGLDKENTKIKQRLELIFHEMKDVNKPVSRWVSDERLRRPTRPGTFLGWWRGIRVITWWFGGRGWSRWGIWIGSRVICVRITWWIIVIIFSCTQVVFGRSMNTASLVCGSRLFSEWFPVFDSIATKSGMMSVSLSLMTGLRVHHRAVQSSRSCIRSSLPLLSSFCSKEWSSLWRLLLLLLKKMEDKRKTAVTPSLILREVKINFFLLIIISWFSISFQSIASSLISMYVKII